MHGYGLMASILQAIAGWNFRWGPFAYMTEHTVRTLPPASFDRDGHQAIAEAAIAVLPQEDRQFLEPELELLGNTFCGFPDQDWMTYGEFSESEMYEERFPDCRRAWDISGYCRYHPLTKAGGFLGHGPPTSVEATEKLLALALEAFGGGRHRDGVRHLGALVHYVQDSGTPCHVIATSGVMHSELDRVPDELVSIEGYEPALLTDDPEQLSEKIKARTQALVDTVIPWAEEMMKIIAREGVEAAREVHAKCANETARATADVIHSIVQHVKGLPGRAEAPAPVGVELLPNGSFELDYDWDGVPDGWHVRWHNLDDRDVIAERTSEQSYAGLWSVKLAKTPAEGVEWVPAWPQAIDVAPGQTFELSVYARAEGATGESFLVAYFYRNNTEEVGRETGEPVSGSPAEAGWRRIELRFTIPEGAERLIVGLRSEGNSGAIWFDSLSLRRVEP